MKYLLVLLLVLASPASAYDAQNISGVLQQIGSSRIGKIAGQILIGLSNQIQQDQCSRTFKISAGNNRGIAAICNNANGKYSVHMGFAQCYRVETFNANQQIVGDLAGEYIFASNAEKHFRKLKSAGVKDVGIITDPNNCSWRIRLESQRFISLMEEIYTEIVKM